MKNNNSKIKIELNELLNELSLEYIESFLEKNEVSGVSNEMLGNIKDKVFEKIGEDKNKAPILKTDSHENENLKKKLKKEKNLRRWIYAAACVVLAIAVALGIKYAGFGNVSSTTSGDDYSEGSALSESGFSGEISNDKFFEENSINDELKIFLGEKEVMGYDVKYPAGDYFPPELGEVEFDINLIDAFEKYNGDELFCVSVKSRSKYEDLRKSLTYDGETYEELYEKRENSVQDAEKFSIVAKMYVDECNKRDIEFFKSNDIFVIDATDGAWENFHALATKEQLVSLEITNQQSYYIYFDNPEKWEKVEFEYTLVSPRG